MAESTEVLIATSDETSKDVYFNSSWTEFTGRSMKELINFGWSDLIHAEEREKFLKIYSSAHLQKRAWAGEFRMVNKEGEYRWLLAKGSVRLRADGSFAGYISSGLDITERKKSENAIWEKEQNLRNTILQAPVAMCIFKGPNHVVDLANKHMFELWGKPADQVLNKPIFEALPEAKEQGFEELLNGVYNSGNTYSAQGVVARLPRNSRIETVYVNFVYEAYRETDGSISGILAIAVDVTEQVTARQTIEEVVLDRTLALEHANVDLKKSNEELAQFAYIASHDLQEPIRKISIFSELLINHLKQKVDDQLMNYLEKISDSSGRMISLIKDVLNYSQLIKENEIFEEVDLNKILENVLLDYDLLIEQKGASVHVESLQSIEANPIQMSQLFGNIIGNALKFSRSDLKPIITISTNIISEEERDELGLRKDLEFINIRFADNGIGFKNDYTDQIFGIFRRLHRRSEYEGTGIGLALCKKICLNHQGTIHATGSSEKGAVFNAIFPKRQGKELH